MFVRARNCLLSYPISVAKNGTQKYSATTEVTTIASQEVEYPPILDLSLKARKRREKDILGEKFKKLETVEEKIYGLNMPRYYGWKTFIIKEGRIGYNALTQAQYITRTHLVEDGKLPDYYNNIIPPEELNNMVDAVKNHVQVCIAFEHSNRIRSPVIENDADSKRNADKELGTAIVYQINRALLANFSTKLTHLLEIQTDYEPRVEAFWFVGGIYPERKVRLARESVEWLKELADEPVDRCFQYFGAPMLQHRHEFPLKEIVSLSESENPALEVPQFKFDPVTVGHYVSRKHATIIPGFWPGDPSEFGILSYHNRDYLTVRSETFKDTEDALKVQAIFGSFSWLYSQACYQGFTMYNDITYPLTTQMVITNGQWWSFCTYQLNTVLLHSEFVDENPRRNICWITEPMKLYDKVENGTVQGLNEDVLKQLIKFYANVPEKRQGVNMKPYLGDTVKVIADIEEDERRAWLERTYKHLCSRRPRHRRIPEIPHWQRIYIFKYNTRKAEKKRDPWQLGINIMKRRLDDHKPAYIPKHLRPNPKLKKVGRWEKTFYPNV